MTYSFILVISIDFLRACFITAATFNILCFQFVKYGKHKSTNSSYIYSQIYMQMATKQIFTKTTTCTQDWATLNQLLYKL